MFNTEPLKIVILSNNTLLFKSDCHPRPMTSVNMTTASVYCWLAVYWLSFWCPDISHQWVHFYSYVCVQGDSPWYKNQ